MFALAEQPGAWDAPTACESWRVKDVIGHLVDTTEGYFSGLRDRPGRRRRGTGRVWPGRSCTSGPAQSAQLVPRS